MPQHNDKPTNEIIGNAKGLAQRTQIVIVIGVAMFTFFCTGVYNPFSDKLARSTANTHGFSWHFSPN